MASLVSIPEDIKLEILKHLQVKDAHSLSVIHSSWRTAARSVIFRRIETSNRTNDKLGRMVHQMLPSIGSYIRRLGISYTLYFDYSPAYNADERPRKMWLQERDRYLGRMLRQAEGLRILCIYLSYDSSCLDPEAQPQLDRSTWSETFEALCCRDTLRTLQLALPRNSYWPMIRTVGFVDLLTQSGSLLNLTTLSLANITVADGGADCSTDGLSSFCRFVQGLPSLSHLQLDNFICPTSALIRILPNTVHSFEFIRHSGHLDALELFEILAGKPNLRHLRFVASGSIFGPSGKIKQTVAAHLHILPLETMHLECPGEVPAYWMRNLPSFLENRHFHYPYLHTLSIDGRVWHVTEEWTTNLAPLVQALTNKARFPGLKVVQLPACKAWSEQPEFIDWAKALKQTLEKHSIEVQVGEEVVKQFKRFTSALQQVE